MPLHKCISEWCLHLHLALENLKPLEDIATLAMFSRMAIFLPLAHLPLNLKMAYILSDLHYFSQLLFPPHP